MSSVQSELYNRFCSGEVAKRSIDALHGAIEKQRTPKDNALPFLGRDVLKTLLYLRLLCTHPALVQAEDIASTDDKIYHKLDDSGKLIALKQILNEAGISSPDLAAADNDISLLYLHAEEADGDGKDGISEALDPDPSRTENRPLYGGSITSSKQSKCLIFAQFTHSLDIVENVVLKRHFSGTEYLRLDGRISPEERSSIAHTFNTDASVRTLLLTTKIGRLGLNLTGEKPMSACGRWCSPPSCGDDRREVPRGKLRRRSGAVRPGHEEFPVTAAGSGWRPTAWARWM